MRWLWCLAGRRIGEEEVSRRTGVKGVCVLSAGIAQLARSTKQACSPGGRSVNLEQPELEESKEDRWWGRR